MGIPPTGWVLDPIRLSSLCGVTEMRVCFLRRILYFFGQFAQDTSPSLLLVTAQEAALKEAASRNLRRLVTYNKSFNCTDVAIGDAVFFVAVNRKSEPRRRAPAKVSDIDETGATVKFHSKTFKVARYCVR